MATLKIQSAEIEPFWATPEILLFLMMIFFNFFHNHRVQKYQNEISPTIYYGISTKTNEKDLKIPNLQLPDWKHPYWMTLYNVCWSFPTEKWTFSECVFVCKRQFNGTISSQSLPSHTSYAVSLNMEPFFKTFRNKLKHHF